MAEVISYLVSALCIDGMSWLFLELWPGFAVAERTAV